MTDVTISEFDGPYRFLSNFYNHQVTYGGFTYMNSEAAFQAQKTLDISLRRRFMYLQPNEAKKLGRSVKLRPNWDDIKDDIMLDIIRAKFSDAKLASKLASTKDAMLVEGNWWHDNHFGNCYCERCSNIKGENILGKCLMKVRQELRRQEK